MRYFLIIPLFILSCHTLQAQQETSPDFQQMRQELLDEYSDFRKEINEKYVAFLSQTWEEFNLFQAHPMAVKPKPVAQPDYQKDSEAYRASEMQVKDTSFFQLNESVQAESKQIIQTTDLFEGTPLNIEYYGLNAKLRYEVKPFYLSSAEEKQVGRMWEEFSYTRFANLLIDMLDYKKKIEMNDWAYFLFVKQVACQLSALKDENSQQIFQHFLLTQSGYDVRLAKTENLFVLLVPFHQKIYELPYLQLEGKSYYVICNQKLDSYSSLSTYRLPSDFKTGKLFSLALSRPPVLPMQGKPFALEAAGIRVKGNVNLNLIHFYRDYLKSDLTVYARTHSSKELATNLMQAFGELRNEKDTLRAVSRLLEWTQNVFQYQTDEKQFGYEKPFFIDENFYYPSNDCEDRAILFAYLVRRLWGLETVLLDYPSHVATAVDLPFSVKGDYILYRKKKYMVCDPTFINAGVGRCMPSYKTQKAVVIVSN